MAEVLGPLPPHVQLFDFLSKDDRKTLFDWVLSNREQFKPATVTKGYVDSKGYFDPEMRIALKTRRLAPLETMLSECLLAALPDVTAGTGARGVAPTSPELELELAAHGDGAHFVPHIDISTGPNRRPLSGKPDEDRILSAVYYFHAEPKAFSGGELRLYRFGADPETSGADPDNHIDLVPVQNSLVAFPSWVTHEVRRVSCPSGDFRDYRFALNCWYCRALAPAT